MTNQELNRILSVVHSVFLDHLRLKHVWSVSQKRAINAVQHAVYEEINAQLSLMRSPDTPMNGVLRLQPMPSSANAVTNQYPDEAPSFEVHPTRDTWIDLEIAFTRSKDEQQERGEGVA